MRKLNLLATTVCFCLLSLPAFTQIDKTGQKSASKPASASEFTEKSAEESELSDFEAFKPKAIDTTVAPTVIAFGSCNKMDKPQTMWQVVAANNPGLWIWLGDIIYADTTDMRALAAHYRLLKTQPEYKKLRNKTQVVGVYDDHDYGKNDACKYYPMKRGSKKCLMDFLDVPLNSPIRKRDGAYQSYTFGKANQKIKVIILDLRYFRDSLVPDETKKKRYIPNQVGSMMGETQWAWLEKELRNSQANLNILCSSVQVIADDHGYEKWGNFPNERKRLLKLITAVQPKNLLILSGDRHMAEISKMQIEGLPYPLYDFTSSGMTHIRSGTSETNRYRVGEMIVQKNFGVLKIRWEGERPTVTMEARGHGNELFLSETVRY
ncbi:MAG: alkaline phosphatase family protein [Saprospiraceae bacterium]|nr:alkaline phosphatase family protein [Saprospiraceae bacterium]